MQSPLLPADKYFTALLAENEPADPWNEEYPWPRAGSITGYLVSVSSLSAECARQNAEIDAARVDIAFTTLNSSGV